MKDHRVKIKYGMRNFQDNQTRVIFNEMNHRTASYQ